MRKEILPIQSEKRKAQELRVGLASHTISANGLFFKVCHQGDYKIVFLNNIASPTIILI